MNHSYDLIVIGGGVLGTFHAYHALTRGLRVALLEKDGKPQGATVRNFGQVVPSGMNSKWQDFGRESLSIYKKIQADFDISVRQEGSIYLASNEEEVQLLEELANINRSNAYPSELLTQGQCLERYPNLRQDYVKAGLFFPEEVKVEPRTMINRLHRYLKQKGLDIYTGETALECDALRSGVQLYTSGNRHFSATKVIICNGSEFKTLYPKLFQESDLVISKLQMMQTKPQPNYLLPSSVLTGLSIRRYEAFSECPSYREIKAREDPDSFEKKWGVHILFKQAEDGTIILGDSHEYAPVSQISDLGFDLKMEIDDFIVKEAKKIFALPTYEIQNRWFGMYSQCQTTDIFQHTIDEDIHIVTGIGGKGMTGSAGFAKHNINSIFNLNYV
ncbi:TIGR03364 family FAD-dependent oxidoreductase [Pseudozobellia thermophila]|uniref:FAD dependent oxidoreductase TIGR03364 n=1 Tax=Pseudozobellia thermophila TaxID=192903 RepID=A0A1M6B4W4_9FLAO|nr:TIGR03364 family FAD-dependent oxidoreductase [Pseudozobellia thermophila]SHI43781.1 FAD dependent oxidoreductase TIGR03364 [Pseudozobellia thermophila]